MVVTQYNPVSVLEGFYGWREKKYYRKEYEEAIDACRNLDWLDLKWRLPNEEDVKFLLFNGLGNIDDRQFNAHRGRNFDFPENGPIAWYYYGDPTTAGSFSGDPNYETQHIPAFRIQAEVIHDKKGEEAQVIARMNTTIRSRR